MMRRSFLRIIGCLALLGLAWLLPRDSSGASPVATRTIKKHKKRKRRRKKKKKKKGAKKK
jgi:hypothetical protein